jgi:2-methylcitrate dehydratase PrpD
LPRYRTALLDWLACAVRGRHEPAAQAALTLRDGLEGRALAAGTAGHVLDFDDTYLPGLAHLSAPTAPAALVLGADVGATVADALGAYAAGFEAVGALSAANHPEMRARGWHPTAVCGAPGAAVAAARVLRLGDEETKAATRLALLQASGLCAAFGSDGKSLQVGMAAAAGVAAARLAQAGARVPAEVISAADGFEAAYGARWAEPGDGRAIDENWIKAYPCCLQTHSAIEAAEGVRANGVPRDGEITVAVHPVSLQAASLDDVADGLQAKFSIPYLVAFTLLHGPPTVESFRSVREDARALAANRVSVRTDAALGESEAMIEAGGEVLGRVEAALGSPARPMNEGELAGKVDSLAGGRLDGLLDDGDRPVREVLETAGIG